jgi:hypothetical protein
VGLASTVVWEVRPGFGSDTNGGGFDPGVSSPGTDWSQQNSAQISYTDLVIGATTTQLTSVGNPFGSVDVGNLVQITSGTGFTTGFYTIVSVSGVTATMDRSVGSAASTGGHGALGGALATMSEVIAAAGDGQLVYLKGTYTATAVQVLSITSDFSTPFTISGYASGGARNDGSQATWTTATNNMNLIDVSSLLNAQFANILFSNTASSRGTGASGGNGIIPSTANAGTVLFTNCTWTGFTVALNLDFQNIDFTIVNLQLDNCIIESSVGNGLVTTGQVAAAGCRFQSNGTDGVRFIESTNGSAQTGHSSFYQCVFYNNGDNGITNQSNQVGTSVGGNMMMSLFACAFVANTGDGYNGPANHSGSLMCWNSIFYGQGRYGINGVGTSGLSLSITRSCAFGANTAGNRNQIPAGPSDVTLTANPFTNPSGGDFSLNSTAGGGASCATAGFQSPIL